jgi:hypothetical protein
MAMASITALGVASDREENTKRSAELIIEGISDHEVSDQEFDIAYLNIAFEPAYKLFLLRAVSNNH